MCTDTYPGLVEICKREHTAVLDRAGHAAPHPPLPGEVPDDTGNNPPHRLGGRLVRGSDPEPCADERSCHGIDDRAFDAAPADINAENVRMSCTVRMDRRFHVLMGSAPMRELM